MTFDGALNISNELGTCFLPLRTSNRSIFVPHNELPFSPTTTPRLLRYRAMLKHWYSKQLLLNGSAHVHQSTMRRLISCLTSTPQQKGFRKLLHQKTPLNSFSLIKSSSLNCQKEQHLNLNTPSRFMSK